MNHSCYFVVQSWMMTDLHLSGKNRDAYASLHRFPVDIFTGSTNVSFLAETLCISKKEVMYNIDSLIKDGLVSKIEYKYHGKLCIQYYTR